MSTVIRYMGGTDTAFVEVDADDQEIAEYLNDLPEPSEVPGQPGNAAWAIRNGRDAYETSRIAADAVQVLRGF